MIIAELAEMTKYEHLHAPQFFDLNWSIRQSKASTDVELSKGTENSARSTLIKMLENENGVDKDDFEDPVDWDGIEKRIDKIVTGLKS